jgi:putative NADH-flavin reductase
MLGAGVGAIGVYNSLNDARLKKICGDALAEGAVSQSLNGVDAVIQTLGVPITLETVLRGTKLFSSASRLLVKGMRAAGVRRLITVTGVETGDSRGRARISPLANVNFR